MESLTCSPPSQRGHPAKLCPDSACLTSPASGSAYGTWLVLDLSLLLPLEPNGCGISVRRAPCSKRMKEQKEPLPWGRVNPPCVWLNL